MPWRDPNNWYRVLNALVALASFVLECARWYLRQQSQNGARRG